MKLILILLFTLNSCAVLRSVSQTSIPKNKSRKISASVERHIVFMLNFDNNYVDQLTQKLIDKCPKGSLEGVTTIDEVFVYFPIIYHKSVISAQAYCTKAKK